MTEGLWLGMRIVAEEFDDTLIEWGSRCGPSVLPIEDRPFAYIEPSRYVILQKAEFEATLAKVLAEGLGVLLVRLRS